MASWAAFGAYEAWQRAKAASEVDGPMLASQKTSLLASPREPVGTPP